MPLQPQGQHDSLWSTAGRMEQRADGAQIDHTSSGLHGHATSGSGQKSQSNALDSELNCAADEPSMGSIFYFTCKWDVCSQFDSAVSGS